MGKLHPQYGFSLDLRKDLFRESQMKGRRAGIQGSSGS